MDTQPTTPSPYQPVTEPPPAPAPAPVPAPQQPVAAPVAPAPAAPPVTPTPAAPPIATMPPPITMMPKPKKGGGVWLTIVLVLVLLAAYGAYAYYSQMWPFASVVPVYTATPMASASISPTPDTTGWQVYTNSTFGFELKLPATWQDYVVMTSQGSQGVGRPDYVEFAMPTADQTKCTMNLTNEVCGYAEIMRVTVYSKDIWDNMSPQQTSGLVVLGQNANVVVLGGAASGALPDDLKAVDFSISKVLSTFRFTK